MKRVCWIVVLVFIARWVSAADAPAHTAVHLLDYVSVDYPAQVRDGKVLDESEYREQQEFSAQVLGLLTNLPDVPQRVRLLAQATLLKQRIDAKAPAAEVVGLARELRWQIIQAYRLAVAPRSAPNLERGEAIFANECAACHGLRGAGDGAGAKGLDPPPSNFLDFARMAQLSPYALYSTITLGVAGTAMRGFPNLSEDERWALAFYVGSLRHPPAEVQRGHAMWRGGQAPHELGTLESLATTSDAEAIERFGANALAALHWLQANPAAAGAAREQPIELARRLLAQSLQAYRSGNPIEAQRLALGAYLEGFELAEATLDTVDRALRQEVEREMLGYRDLLRRKVPEAQVSAAALRIDALLAACATRLGEQGISSATAGVSSFLILFREGLEALLVVAAIIALLVKAGRRDALPWIHLGWGMALVLGMLTWFAADRLIAVSGATRELTEGATALIAAAILLYVGVWLHGKSHARAWQSFIDHHLRSALQRGTLWALAGLSFLAVYREAFETVLFYQALWQQSAGGRSAIITGLVAAVVLLVAIAALIVRAGVRLPIGRVFGVSAILLSVLAVVFTGQGIKALQEAGYVAARPFGHFDLPALGLYPTEETLAAQAVMVLVLACAFVMQNQQKRSVERDGAGH